MPKARLSFTLLVILLITFLPAALCQKVDREGKAWLDTCSDASTLNLTGIWNDPKWGTMTLNQHPNSRVVVGSGDGWIITGVASGNSVCLLFSNGDRVAYSAKLTADASGQLEGGYVKGVLSEKSKTTSMRLTKTN